MHPGVRALLIKDGRDALGLMRPAALSILFMLLVYSFPSLLRAADHSLPTVLLLVTVSLMSLVLLGNSAKEINYRLWRREAERNTIQYLRVLPVKKSHLWLTKISLNLVSNILLSVLAIPVFLHGVPLLFHILQDEDQAWGVAWWQAVLASEELGPVLGLVFGVLTLVLFLFIVFGNAPLLTARTDRRTPVLIHVGGRALRTDQIHGGLFVIVLILLYLFARQGWPILVPVSLLLAQVLVSHAVSYLTFSGTNLPWSTLLQWLRKASMVILISAVLASAACYVLLGSQSGHARMAGWLLLRPFAAQRYSNATLRDFAADQQNTSYDLYWFSQFALMPRSMVIDRQGELQALLQGGLSCEKQKLALSMMFLDASADNSLLPLLLDSDGDPVLQFGYDCYMDSKQFAGLLAHAADDRRLADLARRFLLADTEYQRLVGMELASRVAVDGGSAGPSLAEHVLASMRRSCAVMGDPGDKLSYLRRHDRALRQILWHEGLFDVQSITLDNGLINCEQTVDAAVRKWQGVLADPLRQKRDLNTLIRDSAARHFGAALQVADWWHMSQDDFRRILGTGADWETVDDLMKCHLARQWQKVTLTPDAGVAGLWIHWPADPRAPWDLFAQPAFRGWHCD